MVRFMFANKEAVQALSEEFLKARPNILADLQYIAETTIWRVRAFINPYYQDHQVVEGLSAASINFEHRTPLLQADGTPVKMWQKDEQGNRIGDAAVPIKAKNQLRVLSNSVVLISA